MKTVVVVATLAVTIPAWAQPRPVPIPAVLVNAGQCHTHLAGDRRTQCVECIQNRGKFHTQGHRGPGTCQGQTAPTHRAPPVVGWLHREEQCDAVQRPAKRRRCHECIHNGGRYLTQGGGWGYCKTRPSPPVAAADWFHRPDRCSSVQHPAKRHRCEKCINNGGRYLTQGAGWGYCKTRPSTPPPPHHVSPPPPPPPVSRVATNARECSRALPPQRRRCQNCVRKGGRFFLDGPGRCEAAPPPPPAPSGVATNARECSRALPPPKRRRCQTCVRKGGRFFLDGPGRCEGAPPPPPPRPQLATTLPECNARAVPKPKRRQCHECVRNGGTFVLAGEGRCRKAPRRKAPRPHR